MLDYADRLFVHLLVFIGFSERSHFDTSQKDSAGINNKVNNGLV